MMLMPRHGFPRRGWLVAGMLSAVLVGCGGGSSRPAAPPAAAPAQAQSAPAAPAGPTKIDLDKIFPQGRGRDLVLANFQNCHTVVPIVVLQMDKDAWQRNSIDHRPRVTNLSDAEFSVLYEYLSATFGPHRPVPELPRELLETWTSY
jgi:hypothetical protein